MFEQHGKIIPREELNAILAKEKPKIEEVRDNGFSQFSLFST